MQINEPARIARRWKPRDKRGNVIAELAVSFPFLALLFIGSFGAGLSLDRLLTLGQVTRNAANMYARGISFNTGQNKQLLVNAATGMNLQVDGSGATVVYLTMLTRVPEDAMCGGQSNPAPCGNRGMIVMAQRFAVGNADVHDSVFGMPGEGNIDADGNVIEFMHQSYARASVPGLLADPVSGIQENEFVFAADTHHNPAAIVFPKFFAPDRMHAWAYY